MNYEKDLDKLRNEIDQIDSDIIELLTKRFAVTDEIGIIKSQNNLPPQDENREAKQHKIYKRCEQEYGLPKGVLKDVFSIIISYSKQMHALKTSDS